MPRSAYRSATAACTRPDLRRTTPSEPQHSQLAVSSVLPRIRLVWSSGSSGCLAVQESLLAIGKISSVRATPVRRKMELCPRSGHRAARGYPRGLDQGHGTPIPVASCTGATPRRATWPSTMAHLSPHQSAMPAKQRFRGHEERRPARSIQQAAGRGQEETITLLQPRPTNLPAKNRQLMT
jgi:hypothetical protein